MSAWILIILLINFCEISRINYVSLSWSTKTAFFKCLYKTCNTLTIPVASCSKILLAQTQVYGPWASGLPLRSSTVGGLNLFCGGLGTRYYNNLPSMLLCFFVSSGIAHRDLKPENILCLFENQVRFLKGPMEAVKN